MGQKVNPHGLRVGVIKDWDSRWYASDEKVGDLIVEDQKMIRSLLESYLETGTVTVGNLRGLIAGRKLFPCCFGSALKLEGVDKLLEILDRYAPEREYSPEFAARVYKISRDAQGNRLTWLKVTGGSLRPRTQLSYLNAKGDPVQEKIVQLRLYSGEKFTAPEEIPAGTLAAVTGLTQTWAGQALGAEPAGKPNLLEPVMTYRVALPAGADPAVVLPKLRQLEEEEPQLHLLWEGDQIHVQIMGKVQLEIFRALVKERFSLDVTLEDPRIFYKETIADTVEGVGHFEPLRHYAEVHLLLEPLARGAGLVFDTVCPTDVLDGNFQKLILTHLGEKTHRGVLTGAPITDMKITLLVGKAHLKHTEGGDFRQATYRAVRQGLMQAKSLLLEPWYDFELTLPTEQIGRGITDIRTMGGQVEPPETVENLSVLRGQVPAAEIRDYAETVAAYTQGLGRLQLTLRGYETCHNAEAVIAQANYNPEADVEGYDAGRKVAIMASIAFNSNVTFSQVYTEGITHITAEDIRYAKEFGYVIKLIGMTRLTEGGVEVKVHPMLLPEQHPLSTVRDSFNAVFIHGEACDDAMFMGRGAGQLPTASAVMGDVIDVMRNILHHSCGKIGYGCYRNLPVKSAEDTVSRFFLRIQVTDKPGALANIAGILGNNDVSIAQVVQKRSHDGVAELVIITDPVREKHFNDALSILKGMSVLKEVSGVIRVYGN